MTEDVRWGFLGAGRIAANALAPAVRAAGGAVLQAAAARDRDRAAALEPAGSAYGAYEELLADDDVDAVYISLPNDAHLPWTVAALRAGKHVLCEKPLALTAAEVDQIATAAEESGRLAVEASWYRWHPRVRRAQQLLAAGAIGAVRHVSAGFTFDGVPDTDFRLDPTKGGGAMYDVGCYAVSACQWAFGTPVREVTARAETTERGVDVTTDAVVEFAGGEAEVRASIGTPAAQWLVITGDAGELEPRPTPYTARADRAVELLVSDGRGTRRESFAGTDAYRLMVEEFSSVLRGGAGWVLPLAESRETAAILDACRESAARGGTPVAVARD